MKGKYRLNDTSYVINHNTIHKGLFELFKNHHWYFQEWQNIAIKRPIPYEIIGHEGFNSLILKKNQNIYFPIPIALWKIWHQMNLTLYEESHIKFDWLEILKKPPSQIFYTSCISVVICHRETILVSFQWIFNRFKQISLHVSEKYMVWEILVKKRKSSKNRQ